MMPGSRSTAVPMSVNRVEGALHTIPADHPECAQAALNQGELRMIREGACT